MKAVLLSIKPKWSDLIAQGKKTVEVRKTRPKLETPFKCYIYCTIDGGEKGNYICQLVSTGDVIHKPLYCGMVIGEFVCDRFARFLSDCGTYYGDCFSVGNSRLTKDEIWQYGQGQDLFGWHISELKIYDNPKELKEFRPPVEKFGDEYWSGTMQGKPISRPPQSWCYVEELK